MNIKSLLLGSAAALAAVSGAQAADAIVAAQPEPMEYVRVCDAFGAGFFYIPGSETCLKIDGYVRFQTDFRRDLSGTSDWNSFTRGQVNFDARSDSELGTLRGYIALQGNALNSASRGVNVDQAFIEVGGLKVGYFFNWWDDGLSGETDALANNTAWNAIRYTYTAGAFYAGLAVDELESASYTSQLAPFGVARAVQPNNNIGIEGTVGGAFGSVKAAIVGGYDIDQENGALRMIATADLGPGTLGFAVAWASGQNAYYDASEWTVAAEYAVKVTDKFKITPGFQYFWTIDQNRFGDFVGSRDAWKAGLTLDYQLAKNLSAKASVQYYDPDRAQESWSGYLRLQRSF
ncbi:porin [Rhizobium lemnae]|uniref:Porin n=1 Tax=Rhizobium lemnae TaxID=1214924 RepID=A0ABV8E2V1_9HYPH|nr:porin [Rhizobium lemnae]MCJ8507636.1 porin [Rhizobium lemnae]